MKRALEKVKDDGASSPWPISNVEMEAITAASVAAITIYDMTKAVQKDIVITDIKLKYKDGGKSGKYENI